MIAIPLLLGTGIGAGIFVIIASIHRPEGHPEHPPERPPEGQTPLVTLARRFPHLGSRTALAAFGALVVALLTRWPVGVVAGAALGFFGRDLFASRTQQRQQTDRTEAIASWTEMLRDTMAAAAGLEQAIITTAPLRPRPSAPKSVPS